MISGMISLIVGILNLAFKIVSYFGTVISLGVAVYGWTTLGKKLVQKRKDRKWYSFFYDKTSFIKLVVVDWACSPQLYVAHICLSMYLSLCLS